MEALFSISLPKHFQSYRGEIYRIVEGQHFIATRKLVDSDGEQNILEEILDASKPKAPTSNARGELHYLLYTPFRYPPLKSGGRFHTRTEQSIFYGSQELKTSMAEVAYGKFLFLQDTDAELEPMQVPHTHFVAKVKSKKTLLLTTAPFDAYHDAISHPASYAASQRLGNAMRDAGTELFAYDSARHPGGVNVGLFSVEAFQQNKPVQGKDRNWSVYISADTVEFKRAHVSDNDKESHVFALDDFCIDGKFAAAA